MKRLLLLLLVFIPIMLSCELQKTVYVDREVEVLVEVEVLIDVDTITITDEGRLEITYTNGTVVLLDIEVEDDNIFGWTRGILYYKGSIVSYDDSYWIAKWSTYSKPGSLEDAWLELFELDD